METGHLVLVFSFYAALLFSLGLVFGTTTYFSMPYDGIAYFNCSAMCGNSDTRRTVCIAGGEAIPFNLSTSNCCPVYVSVVFSICGVPTRNDLPVICEMWCSNEIVKTCSWSIHFTGVAPVSSMEYCVSTGLLSWDRPPFVSSDIPREDKPLYNVSMSGVHIASTTDTSVYPNVNNCSATETFGVTTSIGGYQSSNIKTFKINVCNATLLNNTEIYNSNFGTEITFLFECSIKVCSATCLVSIDYGNGTVSNDSFEVLPSNEKSVIVSYPINGLSPGNNTIEISFNSTGDVLDCTVIVPSNSEETITPTSSFPPSSSIYATTTSSVSEGSNEIEITSSNVVEITPVTSSPPPLSDSDSTLENIAIYISLALAILIFLCIVLFLCYQAYHRSGNKESEVKREDESAIGLSNDGSSAAIETTSLNSTIATVVTTAAATEVQEVTESGLNDSADTPEQALETVTKQKSVALLDQPYDEASTERSYVGDHLDDDSDDLAFVSPQQVSNCQTKSTDKIDYGLELEVQSKGLIPD